MTKTDWFIVGNGPSTHLIFPTDKKVIGFNKMTVEKPFDAIISNMKNASLEKQLIIEGDDELRHLQSHFVAMAKWLEKKIGVWPSLGLVTIAAGLALSQSLTIKQMNLLPSIVPRQNGLDWKASPACYHNWLAERRYIIELSRKLDWAELGLIDQDICVESIRSKPFDILSTLILLPQLGIRKAKYQILKLSEKSLIEWVAELKMVSSDELKKWDELFTLDRRRTHTENWWLYDHQYGLLMDKIRTQLAKAQELLLL